MGPCSETLQTPVTGLGANIYSCSHRTNSYMVTCLHIYRHRRQKGDIRKSETTRIIFAVLPKPDEQIRAEVEDQAKWE